ncbi:protein DEK isoform X1 [Nerophis lumbriciformis]|uniref:protein DEK isoform X1 n=1 Tax=Nerophis lumbriciformis TaxID=546530 RepID=UPI002ADF2BB2|nr:protein DEK isoform X1 [Nerophis lumbriciformis]XP_061838950.1 protein DEK isoform X1 [Nerophis lumbriciformis]XP_061838951.1 protein DEK isoform X1 [Nerophis lumbriciformis]
MSNMAEEFKAELLETSQEDELSAKETSLKSAGDVIVEGKRAKKSVDRLDFQAPKHKELTIGEGSGDKLGDIPRTNLQINKLKPDDLKPLHVILFERPGKISTVKKNLRLFNGFPFPAGSEQYIKKREKLLRASHLTNAKLKVICSILDLEKKGTHSDMVDRILTYLISPKNSGKQLPAKKKKRSKKKVSTDKSAAKGKKSDAKAGRTSSSPKKSRAGSKSKAIVMDSSTDDEEHDKEEKAAAGDKSSEKDEESSEKDEESSEKDEESSEKDKESSEQSVDEEEDEEVKKPKKRSRTPAKKTPPPRKRFKADVSDDDLDSEDVEKEKKKKPAARTKKADSSSRNTNTDDTSDEDEPLSRMVRRAPSDKQLKETVRALLKDADLEEMTMKQICQKVFDTYADHDLSGRKNFIKQSVKSLIT